jgi:pimeloyl-ACP methyl ester carboxylesterase
MATITTKDGTTIFYKDWGKGQPIVSHGWPLSADDWDAQMLFFEQKGYRVIAHDRRGHGRSTQTSDGHDMDCMRTTSPRSPKSLTSTMPFTSGIRRVAEKSRAISGAMARSVWPRPC